LELAGLRGDVAFVSAEYRLSERTACKLLGLERSSYRYEPRPDRNAELRSELLKLARQSRTTVIGGCMGCWNGEVTR
jgi:hypothetical protein